MRGDAQGYGWNEVRRTVSARSAAAPSVSIGRILRGGLRGALRVALLPLLAISVTAGSASARQAKKTTTRASTRSTKAVTKRPTRAPVIKALRYTTPRDATALTNDLRTLLTSRTRSGSWGAMVISLTRGDTLFARNPDTPMVPASTMKLFTTAIALDRLGPEHTFSTDILRDGNLDSTGVVHGDLILRGDGDPAFGSRFVRGGPDAAVNLLAEFVAGAGVKRVTGNLVADATAFESRLIPEGWLTRYAGAAYAAPFSALSLNENVIIVGVTPGAAGRGATAFLEPATRGFTITNTVRTVAGSGAKLTIRRSGDDKVTVSGTIGSRAGVRRYQLVVGDPAIYAAGALRASMEAKGIVVDGTITEGATPPTATVVTSLPSPPLSRLVSTMNRESINHFAELLWRDAARGLDRSALGSAENANLTLQDFLISQVGTSANAVTATDGSGLSVLDRVTARSLVQLLSHAHHAPWASAFHASLPVAGESELLRNRMKTTPAQGNLHAKTGTTNSVIGLSGYVTAENGEILAFAFLYNGNDRAYARETIDAMGPTMAAFWRD